MLYTLHSNSLSDEVYGSIPSKLDYGRNLDFFGGGVDITIIPGVSGDMVFQIYGVYYGHLKRQDILGSLTKAYIIY